MASDEKLFYAVLESNVEEIMQIIYTPTVADACLNYSLIYNSPKGMYITINDRGRIYDILGNWPEKDVRIIVVTDGQRILGLGDLGCQGMGIPVGKLILYTGLAGIDPKHSLPIQLDVGTNNADLLNGKYYFGLKHKRTTGDSYYDFLDELMASVKTRFGPTCLIQFEDFANQTAFVSLQRYQNLYCTFNDDIQGTAGVVLAGILTSSKRTGIPLKENVFLHFGAGEASLGIAEIIIMALVKQNMTEAEALDRVWLVDSKGLVVKKRANGDISVRKLRFAKEAKEQSNLVDIVDFVRPTILIGCAAIYNAFTKEVLEKMSQINPLPVIFALSNPTSKSESTASDVYNYTQGNCVFASGSPCEQITYANKVYNTSQSNNCYIFPAIGLAVVSCAIKYIKNEYFLIAAECLSDMVTQNEIDEGRIYPDLKRIRDVSFQIALKVGRYALENGLCNKHIKPELLDDLIKTSIYKSDYDENS